MNATIANHTPARHATRPKRGVLRAERVMPAAVPPPPLENGDEMDADEFLRRYKDTPEDFKAELIDGVVYLMIPFVRIELHGEPDFLIQGWLSQYCFATSGVKGATNTTARLNLKDVPQPDTLIRLLPERGGKCYVGADGCLHGAPELVVEISASSLSIDANKKRDAYRRAGVREYINWRTTDKALDWWFLKDGEYQLIAADKDGVLRSRVFPGLWLDSVALLKGDTGRVMKALRRGLKSAEHAAFVKKR